MDKDLFERISEITPQQLNCNKFSVYDYCGVSMQELLSKFFEKIVECIKLSNQTVELAKWLVSEGLEIEVAKKLELWLVDGTLGEIINEILLKDLEDRVLMLEDTTDKHTDSINKNTIDIGTNTIAIKENKDKIQNNQTRINNHEVRLAYLEGGGSGESLPEYNVDTFDSMSLYELSDNYMNAINTKNLKNIIRVGTFNISNRIMIKRDTKYFEYFPYDLLKSECDIVGIQEYVKFRMTDFAEVIKTPPIRHFHHQNLLNRDDGGMQGNAFFSSKALSALDWTFPSITGKEQRGFITTVMNINGKQVKVYTTHLTHDDDTSLRNQINLLAQNVLSDPIPYKVIVGDFNTNTASDYMPFTSAGYNLAFPLSSKKIDNIIMSPNIRTISTQTHDARGVESDHEFISCEMELI